MAKLATVRAWARRALRLRSRSEWTLLAIVTVIVAGVLVYVANLAPYAPSVPQFTYTADTEHASKPRYASIEVTLLAADGQSRGVVQDGEYKGRDVQIVGLASSGVPVAVGDTVLVSQGETTLEGTVFYFVDRIRIAAIALLLGLFIIAAILVGGRRGVMSVAGLIFSLLIIGAYVIPLIINGVNPFFASLTGAYGIAIVSVAISHGRRRRTYLSIMCICGILTLVAGLAWFATHLAALTGLSEESVYLASTSLGYVDMRGVVAGGMLLATLGALDDIVATQVATVAELHLAHPKQSRTQLYRAAFSVGREHIASLVNTLALAYAGASLPLLVVLAYQASSPLLLINSEYIAIEIVRTLVASVGLVLAVPLSTFVSVWARKRWR